MIRAVFIDIDNTLLDFDAYVEGSMRDGFEKFGLPPFEPHMARTFKRINEGLWQKIERGELDLEGLRENGWNIIFAAPGIDFDGGTFEDFFRDRLFYSAVPVRGATDMLSYLAPKYILCAASNGPKPQQMNRLALAGMDKYFSFFFISGGMGHSKPSPEFFRAAMEEINASQKARGERVIMPGEVMIIGDSLSSDIAGGKAAGFKTCYFNRADRPPTGEVLPDYIIGELSEVRGIL